jgi:hypothetical protein
MSLRPLLFSCLFGMTTVCAMASIRGEVEVESSLDCFPPGLREPDGELVYCEASAVTAFRNSVLIASDKTIPGRSPFFSIQLQGQRIDGQQSKPIMAAHFNAVRKIEGMTTTPDGAHVLVTTAFDRYDTKSAKFDGYNTMLAWPVGEPEQASIIAAVSRDGVTSSSGLRERFVRHLGQPYFKIEGLMALPNQRLVFGIRETGASHKKFQYRILLVEVHYFIAATGEFILKDDLHTVLDFVPSAKLGLPNGIGLSSAEYDPTTGRMYLATSHEEDGHLGAYLWYTTLAAFDAGQMPMLMSGADGSPLNFENKAEGIAILDANHLFIVHDDDRVLGGRYKRQPHQSVYSVVRLVDDGEEHVSAGR